MTEIRDMPQVFEHGGLPSEEHPLLDVLTTDPICPVCQYKGTPISDEDGIAYRHDGRHFLCRVTPKVLEMAKHPFNGQDPAGALCVDCGGDMHDPAHIWDRAEGPAPETHLAHGGWFIPNPHYDPEKE